MEFLSSRQFIAGASMFVLAIILILVGRKLSKIEDDDEMQKMGKGFVIGGKVFLVVDVILGLIKWGIYLLDSEG